MLVPVVIAGGVGSRLWPMSRAQLPKQFIDFPGQQGSLFQATLKRLEGLSDLQCPVVVCNKDHRFLVAEQLRQLGKAENTIMLEPFGRNTAPAVALAAMQVAAQNPEAVLLILPSDHLIDDKQVFHAAVKKAYELARSGALATFGIVPDVPETGYGYIERGAAADIEGAFLVSSFQEKPDAATARKYLDAGSYLWNSGMFLFAAANYLAELEQYAPQMFAACQKAFAAIVADSKFLTITAQSFESCPSDSIDYAVMEHTENAVVVPLDAGWNDLGAWDALWDVQTKDDQGNVCLGDVLTAGVSDSYIQAGSRLVAAVGIEDAVVVETADAVLVAKRHQVQAVKEIVKQLESAEREEATNHTLVYRPWGSYQSLAKGDGYQVKHIVVNPGASLSLQMHHHRAEHWTVIKGAGMITCDEKEFMLHPNESTFIPLGSKHRLANPGEAPVEIIEVQVGEYLGEDDIVRFEDRYGRVK